MQGARGEWKATRIRMANSVIWAWQGSGAPTNAVTGAGKAGIGSIYLDTASGNLYVNTNTKASPTWSLFGGASTGTAGGVAAAVTAHSGGTQALAFALTQQINNVTTVAAAGDSVRLPVSAAGLSIVVINAGAFPMQVFGAGTETINGIATATGIGQGVGAIATYWCAVAGNWQVDTLMLFGPTPVSLAVNGAIPAHTGQTYVINKSGVLADTLAAPTVTIDDGIELVISSDNANLHTITATGLLDTGSALVNVATFNAYRGASLSLMAINTKWKVTAANGVSFS